MTIDARSGLLNLSKPAGLSSFAMVAAVRRVTGVAPVGHGGTLDPAAEGVLPILLGGATRMADFVHEWPKTYDALIQLGATSQTYDREGPIARVAEARPVSLAQVTAVLPAFTGVIAQVPPMHSALKQGGEALYRKARRGETVERPPRRVEVHGLRVIDYEPAAGLLRLEVTCGTGTYVRSLAHDLGARLGTGAYLAALARTAVGPLRLAEAVTVSQMESAGAGWGRWLLPMDLPLSDWPRLSLDADRARAITHGQSIDVPEARGPGRHRLDDLNGRLLAWGVVDTDRRVQPRAVFAT